MGWIGRGHGSGSMSRSRKKEKEKEKEKKNMTQGSCPSLCSRLVPTRTTPHCLCMFRVVPLSVDCLLRHWLQPVACLTGSRFPKYMGHATSLRSPDRGECIG